MVSVFYQKWFLRLRCIGVGRLDRPTDHECAAKEKIAFRWQNKQSRRDIEGVPNRQHTQRRRETFSQNHGKLKENAAG